ncbi:hypothetical protein ACCO45_013546 [Purpureocillium lilacinum]|uniref:Uncharacterized protein n=1 Tax=Purpureocillium lilacinum TaxID=33203 RepID=A0ACC4D6M9_PURLI
MFTFCPLQGALSESTASQSLLELDGGVKVLVDLGWDDSFDVHKLEELEKQIPTLSLVLLTHATASHLAAYVHCCKNFPLFTRIPAYATRPVIDLGRSLTQDLYSSTPAAATTIRQSSLSDVAYAYSQTATAAHNLLLQSPTPDEIARYFSLIQPLKYSQPHQPIPSPFSPPLNGLTITAYNSGHTLGGTIWHIQHGLESIVYAVDWNQARENLRKPTALICSSRGAQAGGRAKRDEHLVEMIKSCVAKGGTVLIPVDSSARVLEMSGILGAAKLYLAGRSMSSTMRYARSMLEWMDNNIVQEFEAFAEGQRRVNGAGDKKEGGPFDFEAAEEGGRVILASDTSMEWGFSKDLLRGLAADTKNLVILTDRPSMVDGAAPSVARTLWEWYKERRDGVSVEQTGGGDSLETVYGGGRELEIKEAGRQPLEGEELAVYQQWLATQRQLQATQQAGTAVEPAADVDDASSESSSDSEDDDDQQQGKALTVSATLGQAGRKNVVLKDEDLGINGRERSFPMAIRRKRTDDFGELIRPEDYLRAEEKDEDHADANVAAEDDKLGKKRKWDDVAKAGPGKRAPPKQADDADAVSADGFEHDELDVADDAEPEELAGPSKLVYASETVTANLRIGFVDFGGLHDKRSLDMLIPLIQPRKLILVAGNRDETMALAADCRAALGGADHDESSPAKRQKTEQSTAVTLATPASGPLPVLDVVPANLLAAARTAARPLHVGDLRLADLRRAMQSSGHAAEFRGEGTLVIDGAVSVRKTAEGRVEVESVGIPVSGRRSTMYEVKKAIYEGLAVVAGA